MELEDVLKQGVEIIFYGMIRSNGDARENSGPVPETTPGG